MSIRERIFQLMKEFGIEPKKSLGQNFLISDHVVQKIVDTAGKKNPDSIIEVGPGLGALTTELITLGKKILLIELDHVFADYWRKQGQEVQEADALQIDWSQIIKDKNQILVSNLPYQISSSLVIDRSLDDTQLSAMILMFQKEVAQRLKAKKGQDLYGMLSVVAQTFWNIELLLEASSGDFFPPPKVASRVLVFDRKPTEIENKKQYLQFMKGCFLHPRKLLVSNLATAMGKNKELITENLKLLKLNEKARAEELELKHFLALYKALGYK